MSIRDQIAKRPRPTKLQWVAIISTTWALMQITSTTVKWVSSGATITSSSAHDYVAKIAKETAGPMILDSLAIHVKNYHDGNSGHARRRHTR